MIPLDLDPGAVQGAMTLLSDEERRRAGLFAHPRPRQRFVVARAELRRQIGTRLEVPARSVEFTCGPCGKPRLARRYGSQDLRFNVSHSGGVAALAFARGREVGVDVEAVRAVPEAERIAAALCTPAERSALQSLGEDERLRGFLRWWTRKEAYVKAQGSGLGGPLDAFDVTVTRTDWTLRDFIPERGFVGAVAFEGRGEEQLVVRRGAAHARSAA